MGDGRILESVKYQQEVDRLKVDPIVVAMFTEMKPDIDSGSLSWHTMNSWEFLCKAGDTYQDRGGDQQESIGGVARALRALAASS